MVVAGDPVWCGRIKKSLREDERSIGIITNHIAASSLRETQTKIRRKIILSTLKYWNSPTFI